MPAFFVPLCQNFIYSFNGRTKLYPIGIQTFEVIRNEDRVYVDKTELVYRLTHGDAKYVFLSRPRRFGKSLLVSTLKNYFEGRRDLFEGLAMANLETEWTAYPVLRFCMSGRKNGGKDGLEEHLSQMLGQYEAKYGVPVTSDYSNIRLSRLIRNVYQLTGRQVIVLIDDYDAPLLDVAPDDAQRENVRNSLLNFFAPLKDSDPYLHFFFMTGVTRYVPRHPESVLNNLYDISMHDEYAAICGITKDEMMMHMAEDVDALAVKNGFSRQQAIDELNLTYGGYHFSSKSPDILNPYNLTNCLSSNGLGFYFTSGETPTYVIEMMRKFCVTPSNFKVGPVNKFVFYAPTDDTTIILPILYQCGFVTIKSCYPKFKFYTLDVPNKDVRESLVRFVLPHCVAPDALANWKFEE